MIVTRPQVRQGQLSILIIMNCRNKRSDSSLRVGNLGNVANVISFEACIAV